MSNSSILGGSNAAPQPVGKDVDALGPSDSSDSGSDVQGEGVMPTAPDNAGEWGALPVDLGNDSDASGTGERGAATGREVREGNDILPDAVVDLEAEDDLEATDADLDAAASFDDGEGEGDDDEGAVDDVDAEGAGDAADVGEAGEAGEAPRSPAPSRASRRR